MTTATMALTELAEKEPTSCCARWAVHARLMELDVEGAVAPLRRERRTAERRNSYRPWLGHRAGSVD